MPEGGEFLLTGAGFSLDERPAVSFQKNGEFTDVTLTPGMKLSLTFDTSTRYCTGWRDIATGERFICPDSQEIGAKYEQCTACQNRTGFNPAFYHATSISEQQQARNQEPHLLYLARFGKRVLKVGISHAKRGRSRLLEQGARDAIILDTFPSADIARHYEASIAQLPGVAETIQLRKKIALLSEPYDHAAGKAELETLRTAAEAELKVSFKAGDVINLDPLYFPGDIPALKDARDTSDLRAISGSVAGVLGSLLFCSYDGDTVFLPLKKFTGYRANVSRTIRPLLLPPQQGTLF